MKSRYWLVVLLPVLVSMFAIYMNRSAQAERIPAGLIGQVSLQSEDDESALCALLGKTLYGSLRPVTLPADHYDVDLSLWSAFWLDLSEVVQDHLYAPCVADFKLTAIYSRTAECFATPAVPVRNFMESAPPSRNLNQLQDIPKHAVHAPELDLSYFDSSIGTTERLFYKFGSEAEGYGYSIGRCDIESPSPRCKFETYSSQLQSIVEASFSMEHIARWKQFFQVLDRQMVCVQPERGAG